MKGTIVVIAALLCAATSVYAKPLKVYLLLGQSNMEGHGVVVQKSAGHTTNGTLEYAVKQYQRPENWPVCDLPTAAANRMGCDAKGANFSLLLDTSGSWKKNELVWIDYHVRSTSQARDPLHLTLSRARFHVRLPKRPLRSLHISSG